MAENCENADSSLNVSDECGTLTMVDVLQEQNALDDDVQAVLGAGDQYNCTFDKGYVDRQAVFSCVTCCDKPKEPAALCLACSLECHEGHDIVELYTKRFVRCDCGNEKFKDFKCKLLPNKNSLNNKNKYNQNYYGLYCTCHKPYPDPEDEIDDEMLQCITCEDWFHTRHLNTEVPKVYEELICDQCMYENPFLWNYTSKKEDSHVDILSVNETESNKTVLVNGKDYDISKDSSPDAENKPKQQSNNDECLLVKTYQPELKAVFWEENWRSKLCKCNSCLDMYERKCMKFLIEIKDTIQTYEDRGKKRSMYDRGMEELDKIDRTQKVDFIYEYNDMKTELTDYLKEFAENKKVVREEDIKEFFSKLESRKKQKVYSGISMNCK